MPQKIKAAIIVDPMGHGFGEFSPEQEVKDHVREYKERVAPAKLAWYRAHSPGDIKVGTDLVIYDFGGMLPGTSLMEDNARYLVKWAEDNSSALVVVVSAFTYNNYVSVEAEERGLSLPNIVVDDGHGDPIPAWWRSMNGLPAPDVKQIERIEEAQLDAAFAEDERANEVALQERIKAGEETKKRNDAETRKLREKLRTPIGEIKLPICLDWEPGQTSGLARFKMADSMVDVIEDTSGEKICTLGGAFGGVYEISFPNGKGNLWTYCIWPEAIYEVVKRFHEERLAAQKGKRSA
jgi:hypothetical protein